MFKECNKNQNQFEKLKKKFLHISKNLKLKKNILSLTKIKKKKKKKRRRLRKRISKQVVKRVKWDLNLKVINEMETTYIKFLEMPNRLDENGDTLSTLDIKEGRLKIISQYLLVLKKDPFNNIDVSIIGNCVIFE